MSSMFIEIFSWWSGNTWGTRLWTWRHGERVGEDQFGNIYFRTRGGKVDPTLGFQRRWVIYKGAAEASKIPPGWHGWMHHRVDTPPVDESYAPREWEAEHQANPTGSAAAHRPQGSMLAQGKRPPATGDYKAWVPGE